MYKFCYNVSVVLLLWNAYVTVLFYFLLHHYCVLVKNKKNIKNNSVLVPCLLDLLIVGPSAIKVPLSATPSLQMAWIYLHWWRLTYDHRILTNPFTQLLLHILSCVINQGCIVSVVKWVSWFTVNSYTKLLIPLPIRLLRALLSQSFLPLDPFCLLVYIVHLVLGQLHL